MSGWLLVKRFAIGLCLLHAGVAAVASNSEWPQVHAPAGARVQTVANNVVLNGQKSRILQIDTNGSADSLMQFYREKFGARRVENRISNATVIASREGDFFHTVRIDSTGEGAAKAIWVSAALAVPASRSKALTDTQAWLPTETATLQSMESTDGGVRSVTLTAINKQAVRDNRELLLQATRQRGFRLLREQAAAAIRPGLQDGLTLWLDSKDEQVFIVIADTGERRTLSVVRTRQTP
jgi:hypothetical protein